VGFEVVIVSNILEESSKHLDDCRLIESEDYIIDAGDKPAKYLKKM